MRPVNVLPLDRAGSVAGRYRDISVSISDPATGGCRRRCRNRVHRVAGIALALALWVACDFGEAIEPPELTITVTAQPATALVGDSVVVRFSATGPTLSNVTLAYGDGTTEVVGTSGASTATGTRRHAYANAGTFEVTASATTGQNETVTARTSVVIRAASPALRPAAAWPVEQARAVTEVTLHQPPTFSGTVSSPNERPSDRAIPSIVLWWPKMKRDMNRKSAL